MVLVEIHVKMVERQLVLFQLIHVVVNVQQDSQVQIVRYSYHATWPAKTMVLFIKHW